MVNVIITREGFLLKSNHGLDIKLGHTLTQLDFKTYLADLDNFSICLQHNNSRELYGDSYIKLFDVVNYDLLFHDLPGNRTYWQVNGLPISFQEGISVFDLFSIYHRIIFNNKTTTLQLLEQTKQLIEQTKECIISDG